MPPSEAQRRANAAQNEIRATDPTKKRTPIWLDPKTVRTLDRKRKRSGEDRVGFVRRMIEEAE